MNNTQWESQINGIEYQFSYEKLRGKHKITVNGESTEIEGGFMSTLLGFDEKFLIDGKEARLVIEKNKPDVVLDGAYTQSDKLYVKRPVWVMVFVVLCMIIPIFNRLSGALPAFLGLGGIALCVTVSKTPLPNSVRLLLCIIVTAAAWLTLIFAVLRPMF